MMELSGNIFSDAKKSLQDMLNRAADTVVAPVRDVVADGAIKTNLSLSGAFPGLQNLNTPEGILNTVGTKLPESIPAGQVYQMMDKFIPEGAASKAVHAEIDPKLQDDAKLSRGEMMQIMADTGNRLDQAEPAAAIKKMASDMLAQQNVDDPNGTTATGLAKFAVAGAIGVQRMQAEMPQPGLSMQLDTTLPKPGLAAPVP
jgi:hypothetical protein